MSDPCPPDAGSNSKPASTAAEPEPVIVVTDHDPECWVHRGRSICNCGAEKRTPSAV